MARNCVHVCGTINSQKKQTIVYTSYGNSLQMMLCIPSAAKGHSICQWEHEHQSLDQISLHSEQFRHVQVFILRLQTSTRVEFCKTQGLIPACKRTMINVCEMFDERREDGEFEQRRLATEHGKLNMVFSVLVLCSIVVAEHIHQCGALHLEICNLCFPCHRKNKQIVL